MNMFKPSKATTIEEYIDQLSEPRQSEVKTLFDTIKKTVPNLKPYFASNMIGFGKYHYKYPSGREGDWFTIGLASQKNYISLYICAVKNGAYIAEGYKNLLPKTSIGKSCVRFKKLADVDFSIIEKLVKEAEHFPMWEEK